MRRIKAKVVSNRMEKTLVVAVNSVKEHPIYKKKYKVTTRLKAHAENSKDFKVGQEVEIQESRPISKGKRWIVVGNQGLKDQSRNGKEKAGKEIKLKSK